PPLLSLPPELHSMIAQELRYPDLLSLKLCHPYFGLLLEDQPTICDRIQWLMSRARVGLPVPQSTKLSFLSDVAFVAKPEVKAILRQRLRHRECIECAQARNSIGRMLGMRKGRMLCFVVEGDCCPQAQIPE
ncbi:hypothetical protein A1O1_04988, partial [Capronia coronata CBS 617.96]